MFFDAIFEANRKMVEGIMEGLKEGSKSGKNDENGENDKNDGEVDVEGLIEENRRLKCRVEELEKIVEELNGELGRLNRV